MITGLPDCGVLARRASCSCRPVGSRTRSLLVARCCLSLERLPLRDDVELLQAQAEAGLDRAERFAGGYGDLAVGHAAEVGEFQGVPLLGRERHQGVADLIAQAAGSRL